VRLSMFFASVVLAVTFTVAAHSEEILTNQSIINLHKAGMSDQFIVDAINSHTCQFELNGRENRAQLMGAGLSETIRQAMIARFLGKSVPVTVQTADPVPAAPPLATNSMPVTNSANANRFDRVELHLALSNTITSESAHLNDQVDLTLVEETKVGELTLPQGSKATGYVQAVAPKGHGGVPGHLIVMVKSIDAPGGAKIPLRGSSAGDSRKFISGKGVAIAATPYAPFKRGESAKLAKGTIIIAHMID